MIGVAILGSGFMARTHAAAWASQTGRAAVRVVASRSVDKAAAIAGEYGADATDDLAAAIARDDVQIVDICLPTLLHRQWAEAAFGAGRDVLLEKPIALDAGEAEAILRARDTSGRLLLVGLVLRFWPEYEVLHAKVKGGAIGAPTSMATVRLSKTPDWNEWMLDPNASGGATVDLLVHDFDQVAALMGTPRTVYARAVLGGPQQAPLHVVAVVECEHGNAVVEGGQLQPGSYPFTSGIRVLGAAGVIEYPFVAGETREGGNLGDVDQQANALRLFPAEGEPQRLDAEIGDAWARQCAYFIDCVTSRTPPTRATGEEAVIALRTALAANRSIASGQVENV